MHNGKITGCLVFWDVLRSGTPVPGDIYLIPLPQDEIIALSQLVPRERNAMRYAVPSFCLDIKFSSDGSRFLFLADEVGESQRKALQQGLITTEGLRLFMADLVHRRIERIKLSSEPSKVYHQYDWASTDRYIVAVQNAELVLYEYREGKWRSWLLSDWAGRFWLSPDRERIYFEGRGYRYLKQVECRPRAKPRSLPSIPPGNQIMNVFPQKEGLLILSHPFIGHIVGYNPRMPKKMWCWQEGWKTIEEVGTIPGELEIGPFLPNARALLVWKPFTKYDSNRGEWVNINPRRPLIRIGLWSSTNGKIRWTNLPCSSMPTPPTSLSVVYREQQPIPLLLIEDPKANWTQIWGLDVTSLCVERIRHLKWVGRLWTWTPWKPCVS